MMPWILSHRAEQCSREIADRHYNRQKPGTPQFAPPGRCLVLRCVGALWVTSWPFAEYTRHRWGGAWVNSCFRRELDCPMRASDLIRAAVAATRWYREAESSWRRDPEPILGMVTFVDPDEVEDKEIPGWCYVRAKFRRDRDCAEHGRGGKPETCAACRGETEGGLHAFRLAPSRMPEPMAPIGAQEVMCFV